MVDGLGFSTSLYSTAIHCDCLQPYLRSRADRLHVITGLPVWLARRSDVELGPRPLSDQKTACKAGVPILRYKWLG